MLKFEKLSEKDIDEVCEISQDQFGANGWQVDLFRAEITLPDHHAYVAKLDNKVVAFLIFMKTCGVNGEDFNILNVATKKGYENQGIGTEMFSFMFKFAENFGIKNFWLEVRENNQNAIKFYTNLGFTVDYVRKGYYSNGENALVMSCTVD